MSAAGWRSLLTVLLLMVILAVAIMARNCGPGGVLTASAALPESSAIPTATATPAPYAGAQKRARALRALRRAERLWNRARSCFDLPARHLKRPRPPAATASEQQWRAHVAALWSLRNQARCRAAHLRARMKHPRAQSGAQRWLPLCFWEGWPRSQRYMLVRVITRESGGNPRCVGGAGGAYYGLFQLYIGFNTGGWDLLNPVVNIRLALQLYHRRGWQPWASTAY